MVSSHVAPPLLPWMLTKAPSNAKQITTRSISLPLCIPVSQSVITLLRHHLINIIISNGATEAFEPRRPHTPGKSRIRWRVENTVGPLQRFVRGYRTTRHRSDRSIVWRPHVKVQSLLLRVTVSTIELRYKMLCPHCHRVRRIQKA